MLLLEPSFGYPKSPVRKNSIPRNRRYGLSKKGKNGQKPRPPSKIFRRTKQFFFDRKGGSDLTTLYNEPTPKNKPYNPPLEGGSVGSPDIPNPTRGWYGYVNLT